MNGENEPEQSSMTEPAPAPTPPAVEIFRCKTCGKEFGKAQGLATHEIRAHKQFWSTNVKRSAKRAVQKPERAKNATYLKYRDRYRAQGLNAKGQPYKGTRSTGRPARLAGKREEKTCPVCERTFKTRSIMGHHLRAIHRKSLTEFVGEPSRNGRAPLARRGAAHKRGKASCPVCKKIFSKFYLPVHVRNQHGMTLGKARASAQGGPQAEPPAAPAPKAREKEGREIVFCPVCGTNIHAVRTAVNFADQ